MPSFTWVCPAPPVCPDDLSANAMWQRQRAHWSQLQSARRTALAAQLSHASSASRSASIGDVPILAVELVRASDTAITLGSNARVAWHHPAWAVNPVDGTWYLAQHRFERSPKERKAGQQCPVCAGQIVDTTTSPAVWAYHLLIQYDDDRETFDRLPLHLHSAGKKWAHLADGDSGYASIWWRCKVHGRWKATMSNRFVGGTGCPSCSPSGLSKEQLRLAFELRYLIPDTEPEPTPLQVPANLRDRWRSSIVRPDILIPSFACVVEYDGMAGHTLAKGGRGVEMIAERDRMQTEILMSLGWNVIRVKVHSTGTTPELRQAEGSGVRRLALLAIEEGAGAHAAALAVADQLTEWGHPVEGLGQYRLDGREQAARYAERQIEHLWSRRVRRSTNGTSVPPRERITIPVGRRFGCLTILSPPSAAASAKSRTGHTYAVKCDCGNVATATATDLRRTRNPKRHCSQACPLIPAPAPSALPSGQARLVRAWALKHAYEMGRSGRIPDSVVDAYIAAATD